MKQDVQLLSTFPLDSDFCHNYLHTLCNQYLIKQCIKRFKSLFVYCFITTHVYYCNNKAFYLENDFISSKNLARYLTIRNTTISSKKAWILCGISDCRTSRASKFKVHQI